MSSAVWMSPLPMTGMSSASTTRAISSQLALPENICVRVRACSVNARAPASCIRSAMLDRIARLVVPAAPGLDRDRQVRGADDRADDALDQLHVAQAARAAVPLYDLLDRAAEVDVDELGPVMLGDERRPPPPSRWRRRRRSGCRSAARPPRTRLLRACSGSAAGWPPRRGTRTARRRRPFAGRSGGTAPPTPRPSGPGGGGTRARTERATAWGENTWRLDGRQWNPGWQVGVVPPCPHTSP